MEERCFDCLKSQLWLDLGDDQMLQLLQLQDLVRRGIVNKAQEKKYWGLTEALKDLTLADIAE